MAGFNSITLDLSPITDQIDRLKTELETTQARLERAEKRITLLEATIEELDQASPPEPASNEHTKPAKRPKNSGLGRGLDSLIAKK